MNRYMIVIPAKNRSFVLECDEGDGAKLETLQKLVSGYVETVPAALDATWAREEADRLVLVVDEDGRLKCKAANQKATRLAPQLPRVPDLRLPHGHPLLTATRCKWCRPHASAGAAAGGYGALPAERQEGSEKQKARRCWNTDELPSDRLKGLSPE